MDRRQKILEDNAPSCRASQPVELGGMSGQTAEQVMRHSPSDGRPEFPKARAIERRGVLLLFRELRTVERQTNRLTHHRGPLHFEGGARIVSQFTVQVDDSWIIHGLRGRV